MKFTQKTAELRGENNIQISEGITWVSFWIQLYLKPKTPRLSGYRHHQSVIFFQSSRGMVKEVGCVSLTDENISRERVYINISSKPFITGYAVILQLFMVFRNLDLGRSGDIPQGCQGFLNSYCMPIEGTPTNTLHTCAILSLSWIPLSLISSH